MADESAKGMIVKGAGVGVGVGVEGIPCMRFQASVPPLGSNHRSGEGLPQVLVAEGRASPGGLEADLTGTWEDLAGTMDMYAAARRSRIWRGADGRSSRLPSS